MTMTTLRCSPVSLENGMPPYTLSVARLFDCCTATLDPFYRGSPSAHNYEPGLSLFWSTASILGMQVDTHVD
jgi:hypothetical protein